MDNFIDDLLLVIPPDRQRREFNPERLAELATSIENKGLLHAPVLRNDGQTLVAGERRIRAMRMLHTAGRRFQYRGEPVPPGFIPFTCLGELPPDLVEEAELEENTHREDITWQERVEAYARLQTLRQKQNPKHTITQTAQEIFGDDANQNDKKFVSDAIVLAKHLDDDAVRTAKNEKEAMRVVKKKMNEEFAELLAKKVAKKETKHILRNMAAEQFLNTLPDSVVDVILTDPPYGIDMHKNNSQSSGASTTVHEYDDSEEYATEQINILAYEGMRVTREHAHLYMFHDIRFFNKWKTVFESHGWYVWPFPIIWSKNGVGSLLGNANGPRHCYEAILFAQKGSKRISEGFPDVITQSPANETEHAAEKPVQLYTYLLRRSVIPGNTVLDPFCGSGTIFPAANHLNLTAFGCELDPKFYNIALSRLEV